MPFTSPNITSGHEICTGQEIRGPTYPENVMLLGPIGANVRKPTPVLPPPPSIHYKTKKVKMAEPGAGLGLAGPLLPSLTWPAPTVVILCRISEENLRLAS